MAYTNRLIIVFMVFLVPFLFLISGCGSKTQVKYIVPTGHAVAEPAYSVKISDNDSDGISGKEPGNFVLEDYKTVVDAPDSKSESFLVEDADIADIVPSLCSINDVILGYVGCYYTDEGKSEARVTLKNSGRGDIIEMWFYVVYPGKEGYGKAPGFGSGYTNDYILPLADWAKEGKIMRILITPVFERGNNKDACNNRQLLLLPEENCREVVG